MSREEFGERKPVFISKGIHTLTEAELTEQYGDTADNVHSEENRREVELLSLTGKPYLVHLGLPQPLNADPYRKQYEPPYEPHVFTSDRFILRSKSDPNDLLVDEPNLRVLFMHGRWQNQTWVPSDAVLRQKGVTIPDLLLSFEACTGTKIDVVWTCQIDDEHNLHKLKIDTGHPYIYPIAGYAVGRTALVRGKLTVELNEAPDEHSLVEYQEWLLAHTQNQI